MKIKEFAKVAGVFACGVLAGGLVAQPAIPAEMVLVILAATYLLAYYVVAMCNELD